MTGVAHDAVDPMLAELRRRRLLAAGASRQREVRRHHERGNLTGMERIELLVDPGSFVRTLRLMHSEHADAVEQSLGGDGTIHGFGTIEGRPVAVFASDPTVKAATGSTSGFRASHYHATFAERCQIPYFDLHQGGGMRITEMMTSGFAGQRGPGLGSRHLWPRGSLHLCAILGDYYAPWNFAQCDVIVMRDGISAAMTSPILLEAATGQSVSPEELGGTRVHAEITGQIDATGTDEADTLGSLRRIFSYLPASPGGEVPRLAVPAVQASTDPTLRGVLPENPTRTYDMEEVVRRVVDTGSFLPLMADFARNMLAGLARLDGQTVAILANQPRWLAGAVDVPALVKSRRMLQLADTCRLPVITFVDTPGALTTIDQEHNRLVREIYQTSMTRIKPSVPKLSVIVRKGIGFALFLMGATDPEGLTFAWPTARIAFTGPEPAVRVTHLREIAAADDPVALTKQLAEGLRAGMEPWKAGSLGYLDAIIDPAETRQWLTRGLQGLRRR